MTQATFDAAAYRGAPPENYERYFVPAIGAPLANDLVAAAGLRPGDRVLDAACGTGIVTRIAARQLNQSGSVAGLDVNPGMLAVARAATPRDLTIDWYETSAEAIPLADGSFDVVLCQMGLQFFSDKPRALKEMHRVLAPGGRLLLNVPGPTPPWFTALGEAAERHVDPQCAAFVDVVFSLHGTEQISALLVGAGFQDIDVTRARKTLRLPPPEDFLWQYVHSTPLAALFGKASEARRAALTAELGTRWKDFVGDGAMTLEVGMTTARATKQAAETA
jgi:ubiquinone/menaquinone biosynthesis C-methylase UbiE